MSRTKNNRTRLLWLYLSVAGSLLLRLSLFDYESGDYHAFLSPWCDLFVQRGRWHGLAEIGDQFGSYAPLYMYLLSLSTLLPIPRLYAIKLLTVGADYLGAWYIWRLARRARPKKGSTHRLGPFPRINSFPIFQNRGTIHLGLCMVLHPLVQIPVGAFESCQMHSGRYRFHRHGVDPFSERTS